MLLLEGCCVYIDSCNSVSLFQGTQTCYVEVWDRPSLQLHEVNNVTCSSTVQARSKRVCIAFVVVLYWYAQGLALK